MAIDVEQTQVMMLLLAAGLIVWTAAVLWIVVAAFRTSIVWGVLLAVLTPLYVVYALLEWSRPGVRYAFLVSVLGLLMAGAGWYGGAGRLVVAQLDRLGETVDPALRSQVEEVARHIPTAAPPDEPLPNAERVPDDPDILSVDPLKEVYQIPPARPLPPSSEEVVQPTPVRTFSWQRVSPDLLHGYLGSRVRLRLRDGRHVEGMLMPGADESVMVEVQQGSGRIGYEYLLSQIQTAEVLVPVEAGSP